MVKYLVRMGSGFTMLMVVSYMLISGAEVTREAWLFLAGIYGLQQFVDGSFMSKLIRRNGREK